MVSTCHVKWMNGIVLVGFMGSGKSTVGKILADQCNLQFVDTDDLVVERMGMSIPDIFDRLGEQAFRDAETAALESLLATGGAVVATGGGMVLRDENWPLMRRVGPVVFLQASDVELKGRLCDTTGRPLADGMAWTDVLERYRRRMPFYRKADLTVQTAGKTPAEIVETILAGVEGLG